MFEHFVHFSISSCYKFIFVENPLQVNYDKILTRLRDLAVSFVIFHRYTSIKSFGNKKMIGSHFIEPEEQLLCNIIYQNVKFSKKSR